MNLPLDSCPEGGGDLSDQPVQSEEKRQVFDLPAIRMLITQYLAERKTCPHCGAVVSAGFPCGVTAPVQYGPGMQSAMTYLNVLPTYTGMVAHDSWGPYDQFGCDYSRCNAHLLREVKAFAEIGRRWAGAIIAVLLEMKNAADEAGGNWSTPLACHERWLGLDNARGWCHGRGT